MYDKIEVIQSNVSRRISFYEAVSFRKEEKKLNINYADARGGSLQMRLQRPQDPHPQMVFVIQILNIVITTQKYVITANLFVILETIVHLSDFYLNLRVTLLLNILMIIIQIVQHFIHVEPNAHMLVIITLFAMVSTFETIIIEQVISNYVNLTNNVMI